MASSLRKYLWVEDAMPRSRTLDEMIDDCIRTKWGDKEFGLYYLAEGSWLALSGKISTAEPEVKAEGATAIDAVFNLCDAINEWNKLYVANWRNS